MSSPFDIFRKNQKAMFAILGVVCMITFVIAPAASYLSGPDSWLTSGPTGGAGGANPVAVSWTGGKIREQELVQMQISHRIAVGFLQRLLAKGLEKKASPRVFGLSQQSPGIPGEVSESIVIDTLIYAEKGKQMGIVVSDETVKEFIANIGGYALSADELRELIKVSTNRQMSETELFEQLRMELLAQQARLVEDYSNRMSRAVSLPEAWDYHNRLNRRVNIEAYPIEVAKFEDQVTQTPTEKEKLEIFDKYKHDDPNPNSPTPGFHRPPKLAFEYFKVNFAPFLEEAKKGITEEQLKAEYDTRVAKGEFKVPVLPEPKDEPKKDEEKKDDAKKDDTKKEDGEKKVEDSKEKPAVPANEEKDKDAKKDSPAATEPKAEEPKPEPKKTDCEDGDEDKKADEVKSEVKKPAETKADDKTEEKPADTKAEKPAEEEKKPAAEEKKEEPKRTKTFEEVKDELHRSLASPAANDAMKKAMQDAFGEVNKYSRQFIAYQTNQKNKASKIKIDKPEKFDSEGLAKKLGFEAGSTPLISQFEAKNYDIGKNGIFYNFANIRSIRDPSELMIPFGNYAFSQRFNEYNPQELESNIPDLKYIFWVTETKEAETPKFADKDVQEAIVQAWKKDKAFELAKKEAASLLEKAKGKELKEVVDEKQLIAPPPFSWMTTGAVAFGAAEPRMSQISGIELAGPEFMEAVCNLPVGQSTVAWNFNHAMVYVVKVVGQEPSDQVLRERFHESGVSSQIQQLAVFDTFVRSQRQAQAVAKEYNIVWHRPIGSRGEADE